MKLQLTSASVHIHVTDVTSERERGHVMHQRPPEAASDLVVPTVGAATQTSYSVIEVHLHPVCMLDVSFITAVYCVAPTISRESCSLLYFNQAPFSLSPLPSTFLLSLCPGSSGRLTNAPRDSNYEFTGYVMLFLPQNKSL